MAGKAIRTENGCGYSGVAFFYYTAIYHQHIVTKIAAVKIRLGISQPHLLAVFHSFDLVMI